MSLTMGLPTGPEVAFLLVGMAVGVIIGLLIAAYVGARWQG